MSQPLTLEEYISHVRALLTLFAEGDSGWEAAAREMLETRDMPRPEGLGRPPYIEHPYAAGYTVGDCVRSIMLCADSGPFDEDRSLREQAKLRDRYGG